MKTLVGSHLKILSDRAVLVIYLVLTELGRLAGWRPGSLARSLTAGLPGYLATGLLAYRFQASDRATKQLSVRHFVQAVSLLASQLGEDAVRDRFCTRIAFL